MPERLSVLKVVAGALRAETGVVEFRGTDLTRTATHVRIQRGIGYLMQSNNIFPSLSVDENLHLSFWHGNGEYAARLDWVMHVFNAQGTPKDALTFRGERHVGHLHGFDAAVTVAA